MPDMNSRELQILNAALRLAQTRLHEFTLVPNMDDPPTDKEIDRMCERLTVQAESARQAELRLSAQMARADEE